MTPTEQDNELRESTRKSIALLIAQRRGEVKWDEQDYITASNILFVCTKLITADRKRVALEARLDEARYIDANIIGTPRKVNTNDAINRRIAELKVQQEEV